MTNFYILEKRIDRMILTLTILGVFGISATAQTVTGTVIDEAENLPLIGVNIEVKNTNRGTITDIDGNYEVEASPGDTIIFSYTGYGQTAYPVTGSSLNINMSPNSEVLDEVVVIGYGAVKKDD